MVLTLATSSPSMAWTYWVLAVAGELDDATAPGLGARMARLLGSNPRAGLLLDLGGVTFIDCAGLRPLVQAHRRLGEQLYLRSLRRAVLKVVDLVGLANVFQILPAGTSWPDATWRTEGVARSYELSTPSRNAR